MPKMGNDIDRSPVSEAAWRKDHPSAPHNPNHESEEGKVNQGNDDEQTIRRNE